MTAVINFLYTNGLTVILIMPAMAIVTSMLGKKLRCAVAVSSILFAISFLTVNYLTLSAIHEIGDITDREKYAVELKKAGFQEKISVDKDKTTLSTTVIKYESSAVYDLVQFDLTQPPQIDLKSLDCENPNDCYEKSFVQDTVKLGTSIIAVTITCDGDTLSCAKKLKFYRNDVVRIIAQMSSKGFSVYGIKL